MKLIQVAATALNQTPFDWSGNEARIRQVLTAARAGGSSVVCLPELVISGYGCEDVFHMPHLQELAWNALINLLPDTQDMIVAIGLPVAHRGALFNGVAVAVNGRLVAIIPKKLLAGDSEISETLDRDGLSVPIGDLYIEAGGVRIGFEICEEAWVANRPGGNLARKGIDIILNPSASHFSFGKRLVRERFVSEGSRAFNVAYVYSNLLGNEAGSIVFDGGAMIASEGKLIAFGERFSWKDWVLTSACVDIDINRMNKTRSGSFQPLLGQKDTGCVDVPFSWPDVAPTNNRPSDRVLWEGAQNLKEEEFCRAVSLGLFDYLRKSRLHGFTISLSGGVDSAAATSLACLSLLFAANDIGMAGLKERLGFIPEIHNCHTAAEVVGKLVSTVYQSTKNSSDATARAARDVANGLGTTHFEWSIDKVVDSFQEIVGGALGIKLDWQHHDLALQNIQARTRSPGVWMLANMKNHLLLATSNRSESAVGYATMDGDTSGGLAPLSGIDKAYLRTWLKWLELEGPKGLGPQKSLHAVNCIPPSAELRPLSSHQTDEDDLMPYVILDAIERAMIRDKKSPLEVFETIVSIFPTFTKDQHRKWVKLFFKLWCQSQWKRERFAPGFQVDDINLDPKSWCRFPVLSGGFAAEIAELDARRY
ncbi:MAG: NAD(+) synthase [Proteobacteria bacterium]|nr:NAD(+) synthase [Pseudomonadota bacterium]